jgi:putative spermidine/putrescine transport system substrate-binding protein
MSTPALTRRTLLAGGAVLATTTLLPRPARAAGRIIAPVYPGPWEEAYRAVVLPAVKKTQDVDTVLTPLLALDQVAKVKASRSTPPFDVFLLDPGPVVVAAEDGLIDKFDPSRCKNIGNLQKSFYDDSGVAVAAQIVGIAYNPKKVERPKGWKDLFDPKYYGKVGISGFGTTFGTSSLIEISKQYGGSMTNVDPAFEQLKKWLPHVGVIAQNPVAVNTLFQQGQMDVTYTNYQTVSTLKGRGVDIEFVKPDTGPIAFYTTLHVVKNAPNKDNAYKYIDTVLSTEVQAALQKPPYNLLSVNKNVPLQPDMPTDLVKSHAELASFIHHDWRIIAPLRAGWIERFNKEIRQ